MRKVHAYVRIQGVKESEQAFVVIDRTYRRLIQAHVDKTAAHVLVNAKTSVPTDTGATMWGLKVKRLRRMRGVPVQATEVISNARQTFAIERGSWLKNPQRASRGGRKSPPPFMPGTPLAGWAERHGVNAAALAMSFWKKGKQVDPKPFLGPSGEKERPQWNAGIRRIVFEEVPRLAERRAARMAKRASHGR